MTGTGVSFLNLKATINEIIKKMLRALTYNFPEKKTEKKKVLGN